MQSPKKSKSKWCDPTINLHISHWYIFWYHPDWYDYWIFCQCVPGAVFSGWNLYMTLWWLSFIFLSPSLLLKCIQSIQYNLHWILSMVIFGDCLGGNIHILPYYEGEGWAKNLLAGAKCQALQVSWSHAWKQNWA